MAQTVRNMASIRMDLKLFVDKELLHFSTVRPSSLRLEAHLATMHQTIRMFKPTVVAMDPISVFMAVSERDPVRSMLTRLVDYLKMLQITTVFTHLSNNAQNIEATHQRMSSIMDTWILMRDVDFGNRRQVMLRILKSRGMAHSREMVEFIMSSCGLHLGKSSLRSNQSSNDRNGSIQTSRGEVENAEELK